MDALPLARLAQFAGGEIVSGNRDLTINRVSTDSRTLRPGDLFVALRGENFDGHRFVTTAVERGAAGVVVDRDWSESVPDSCAVLRVAETLAAYQQIAAQYRQTLPLKVVAITGSNGKTSTKDFVAAVLGRRFRVTKTEGNLNNHVGVPRTMLEASARDEIAVWEIGMNRAGEVAALAKLARPDVALITNVGVAHIEFFGTRAAIAAEKGELAEAVGADGTVILNADDDFSASIADRTRGKTIFAGINHGTVRATDVRQTGDGSEFTIVEGAHRCRAQLPVPGSHMVQNALLAIAAGRVFGLSLEECATGLASAALTGARLQIKQIHGLQFIDDSYNANPDSMKAALRTLAAMDSDGRRFAVLGGMAELGAASAQAHREVGEAAAQAGIDELITIGEEAREIARSARSAGLENAAPVASAEAAAEILAERAKPGDVVLVKGSRSARTERVLEEFAKSQSAGGCAR